MEGREEEVVSLEVQRKELAVVVQVVPLLQVYLEVVPEVVAVEEHRVLLDSEQEVHGALAEEKTMRQKVRGL